MNSQQTQRWQTILKLTQQMRELAVPNESLADLSVDEEYAKQPWHAISELERQRLDLLKDFFSSKTEPVDTKKIAEGIQLIQDTDSELTKISLDIRQQISRTFNKMGNAQRAASAYSDISQS